MNKGILALFLLATTSFSHAQSSQGPGLPATSLPSAQETARPAGAASIREYDQPFPTYPYTDPSPLPLLNAVYPYFRYDGFTDKPVTRSWRVVELQNDYLRILILPEVGGKIWTAIEKSTNKPFLYFNHTVKFRDVAMRGPWTSGGLESNFGIIGHTPNCSTPVDYTTLRHPDGSVSCIIGTLDLLTRSCWRMEIRLPKDKAYFSTRAYWYNTTALEQPYYHWMNAGLKAGGNLEFIYPGNRYIGHDGEYADWPVNKQNGKHISWYNQNDFGGYKSYHVFGKYTDFSGAYWHDDNYGMVRYATHDDKAGKKLWIWGLSGQGMIWERLLTDTDGQYIELQSGRLFNQNTGKSSGTPFKHRAFMPYGADTWDEDWYPVLGTQGFVTANRDGALNIQWHNGWLKCSFSPTHAFEDTLTLTLDGKPVYTRAVSFQTLHLFTDSIRYKAPRSSDSPRSSRPQPTDSLGASRPQPADSGPASSGRLVAELKWSHLQYDSDPNANTLARPVDAPANFDWNSAYGNWVKGQEAVDQKNYAAADTAFAAALQKDSNYTPALVAMANLAYRNMRYPEALAWATHAIAINTEDGAANFIYGLANESLGRLTDARDGFDIAALDPAWRSAAYTCLARIGIKEKDFARATRDAQKAMLTNALDMEALQLQAICARLSAHSPVPVAQTQPVLTLIDSLDPLNHFSHFEKYLAGPTEANKQAFLSGIRNELPQETFLQLAIWYYDLGLEPDALQVLRLADTALQSPDLIPASSRTPRLNPSTAEIRLWLSHLTHTPIDWPSVDPVLAFPFRPETASLLEQCIRTDNRWFLKYQLALIYYDRNRLDEAKKLLLQCGNGPNYAPFYVFRAQLLPEDSSCLRDLLRARSLDAGWRYPKLLTEYYIRKKQPAEALAIIEPWCRAHPDRNTMGLLYARVLLANNQLQKADGLLSQLQVLPAEGSTSARDIYREVKLRLAIGEIKRKAWRKALVFIEAAKQWPENLGSGTPYPQDRDHKLEDYLTGYCENGLHNKPLQPLAIPY